MNEVPNIPTYRTEEAAGIPYRQAYAEGKRVECQLLDGTWVAYSPTEVLEVEKMRVMEV